jgi:hypothetical protein
MCPIQLMFLLYTIFRIFLSSFSLYNSSSCLTRSVQLISILLQHHSSKLSRHFGPSFRNVHVSAPHEVMPQMQHFTGFFLTFKSSWLQKIVFMFECCFAMAILDLICRVHLASFVVKLHKQLKRYTFSSFVDLS